MREVRRLLDREVKARVRTQLEHMKQQGTLVDWVMAHYPRVLDNRGAVFGDELKKIYKSILKKAGHTVCPACGRELIAEKSDDIEVAPEILEDTEAAKEGVFE